MSALDTVLALQKTQTDNAAQMALEISRLIADLATGDIPTPHRPGYCSPVGNDKRLVWPGSWVDATGYARYYSYGWHTGADLNLNTPGWDADRHRPVYAIGDGEVYAVRKNVAGWGTVICIYHTDCLSRYAHCENIAVKEGQSVEMGDYLGNIGNAGGRYPYHLHFDIARLTARMMTHPLDWPGKADDALKRVKRDYIDPAKFLRGEVG